MKLIDFLKHTEFQRQSVNTNSLYMCEAVYMRVSTDKKKAAPLIQLCFKLIRAVWIRKVVD